MNAKGINGINLNLLRVFAAVDCGSVARKSVPLFIEHIDDPLVATLCERDLVIVRPTGPSPGEAIQLIMPVVDAVRGATT